MSSGSSLLVHRQAWIFDLDGTLTQPVHDFDHIRRELGIAQNDDILATLEALPEDEKQQRAAQLNDLELYYAEQARPAPGVLELLECLAESSCQLGILTRNTREIALSSLEAIGALRYFDASAVLGRDDARPKPDAHGIQLLLEKWSCNPEQAVMVGDYCHDLASGRAAGAFTVHVDDRDRHWPELTDLRVESLSELAKWLR